MNKKYKKINEIIEKSECLGTDFEDYLKESLEKDEELKLLYEKEGFLNNISFNKIKKKKPVSY